MNARLKRQRCATQQREILYLKELNEVWEMTKRTKINFLLSA